MQEKALTLLLLLVLFVAQLNAQYISGASRYGTPTAYGSSGISNEIGSGSTNPNARTFGLFGRNRGGLLSNLFGGGNSFGGGFGGYPSPFPGFGGLGGGGFGYPGYGGFFG